MKKRLLLIVALISCIATAYAGDIYIAVFSVNPPMHCENCENKVKKNLRFEKGVKEISASAADQKVIIKYDAAKTNTANLQKAFEKIGYTATLASATKEMKHAKKADKKHDCEGDCKHDKKADKKQDCKGDCKHDHKK